MTILTLAAAALVATNILPTIVVEATRIGCTPIEMSQHIDVLTRGEIAASGAKNVPGLLSRVPGLSIYNLGADNPALAQIQMRGYGESGFGRVLVSVDGERLNNPDMSAPNLARIPISGVERIEILYGPQTVLYGDGASAGIINVITDPNDYTRRTYAEIHGGSFGTVGAAAGTRGGFEEDGLSYFADGGWDHSDGYRDHSDYTIGNLQGGLRKNFENGSWLRANGFFNDTAYDLPGPLSKHDAEHHPTRTRYNDRARLHASGLTLSGSGRFNEENRLDAVFTASSRRAHFVNGNFTAPYADETTHYHRNYHSDIWSFRFAPQFVSETDLFGHQSEFIAGAETRWDRFRGRSVETYPDFALESRAKFIRDRLTGGVFTHEDFHLLDSLSLVLGARLERMWNRNNQTANGVHCNDDFVAYEAALNWRPVDDAKFFIRWCRFYRSPFIDEYRYRDTVARECDDPERGWNFEFGGSGRLGPEWKVSAIGYYSEVNHEIHYNPFAMSNENSPWTHRRFGTELALAWERDKVAGFRASWSAVDARKAQGTYDHNWVPGVPRQQLDVEGHVFLAETIRLLAGLRLIGARYAISDTPNANGRIGTDCIFRLGAEWRPRAGVLDGFSFAVLCENLFDRAYCDYAVASVTSGENAWYPACGRSFAFTVRYEF